MDWGRLCIARSYRPFMGVIYFTFNFTPSVNDVPSELTKPPEAKTNTRQQQPSEESAGKEEILREETPPQPWSEVPTDD